MPIGYIICFYDWCMLSRFYGIDTPINSSKGIKEFKELASTLIDHKEPGNYNQAITIYDDILEIAPNNIDAKTFT